MGANETADAVVGKCPQQRGCISLARQSYRDIAGRTANFCGELLRFFGFCTVWQRIKIHSCSPDDDCSEWTRAIHGKFHITRLGAGACVQLPCRLRPP